MIMYLITQLPSRMYGIKDKLMRMKVEMTPMERVQENRNIKTNRKSDELDKKKKRTWMEMKTRRGK